MVKLQNLFEVKNIGFLQTRLVKVSFHTLDCQSCKV